MRALKHPAACRSTANFSWARLVPDPIPDATLQSQASHNYSVIRSLRCSSALGCINSDNAPGTVQGLWGQGKCGVMVPCSAEPEELAE